MSAVLIRFSRAASTAAITLIAFFLFATSVGAAPLGVSLTSLTALEQPPALPPSALPAPPALSHYARLRRMHRELVRMRRARAARIRTARVEMAHMQRKGQEFCLATAVYFEARDEPIAGQKAVAAVILARTRQPGRPTTVCGVVFQGAWRKTGCQFSFACDGRPDVPHWQARWERAQRSAAYVWRHQRGTRGIVRGATFYHTKYVHPRWDRYMVRVAHIGLHYFYRPRRGRLS
jgi:spore germination cell wall hydrolase CwlJ-like protein